MKLIIGLGNPGKKYIGTRHNTGFAVMSSVAKSLKLNFKKNTNYELVSTDEFILLKPFTFVNLSGTVVSKILQSNNISPADLFVVHDDIDLPLGTIRQVKARGCAGHHGVENIIKELKTNDFNRIRCGIGRPLDNNEPIESFVLEKFSASEAPSYHNMIQEASQIILQIISEI